MSDGVVVDAEAAKLLDDPVWAALTIGHRALAEGSELAWRYPPKVSPFAAIADRTPAAYAALAALLPTGGRAALATIDRPDPPRALVVEMQAPIVQLVLTTPVTPPSALPAHVVLGSADVDDMLDLTSRTKPGPFDRRTIELGRYIGLRVDGTLAAMAGERMRFGKFVEISAVCVDPAHRGQGLAGLLMTRLAERLQAARLTPILHVFADNAPAIAVYERLGYRRRCTLHMTLLRADT